VIAFLRHRLAQDHKRSLFDGKALQAMVFV
jgi:hypothetical protein